MISNFTTTTLTNGLTIINFADSKGFVFDIGGELEPVGKDRAAAFQVSTISTPMNAGDRRYETVLLTQNFSLELRNELLRVEKYSGGDVILVSEEMYKLIHHANMHLQLQKYHVPIFKKERIRHPYQYVEGARFGRWYQ